MMRAVPIRMSSFGKRSGIEGYSNELTKALTPPAQGEPSMNEPAQLPQCELSAVQMILSTATAGEARAKMAATMSGVRTRRPGL